MKKNRVDKIIALIKDMEKSEAQELCDRLMREHHIWLSFSIPVEYFQGYDPTGKLLKEAG